MSSAPTITPYALQIPTKRIKKGQRKVLDLSCKEQTANIKDSHVDVSQAVLEPACSNQSGLLESSSSTVTGVTDLEPPTATTGPAMIVAPSHPVPEPPQHVTQGRKYTNECAVTTVEGDHTRFCTYKSFKYSHGPVSPWKLRTLATTTLSKHFPGLDPLDVALLFAKKSQMHENAGLSTPACLAQLCRDYMNVQYPELDVDLRIQQMTQAAKQVQSREIDLEAYLKELAQKKVTVMIPKLDREVIQLWTKSHWFQLDPYSDLEETKTDISSTSSNEDTEQQT